MSVGGQQSLRLASWAREVREFFRDEDHAMPYLVGSATEGKEWRDVDVVVILPDDEFKAMFGIDKPPFSVDGKWAAFCAAFSAWGESFTGLPIDFKVQPMTWANATHQGRREALGIRVDPARADDPESEKP